MSKWPNFLQNADAYLIVFVIGIGPWVTGFFVWCYLAWKAVFP